MAPTPYRSGVAIESGYNEEQDHRLEEFGTENLVQTPRTI